MCVSRSMLHVKPSITECFVSRWLYASPHGVIYDKSVGLSLPAGIPPPGLLNTWYVWDREGAKVRERV